MKLHEEIDSLRRLFLAALEDMASRSSAVEGVSEHPVCSSRQARGCPSLLLCLVQVTLQLHIPPKRGLISLGHASILGVWKW